VNFIGSLISCDAPERTLFLRISQLSILLSWEKEGHPLMKIRQAAELVESLLVVEDKEEKEPIPEMLEPLLLPPEALLNQFALRSTATVCNGKEKVKKSLLEIQNDNTVDLLALATELLPADFNLLAEAQRVCSKVPLHYTTHTKGQDEAQDSRETQKQINAPTTKTKQPFGKHLSSIFYQRPQLIPSYFKSLTPKTCVCCSFSCTDARQKSVLKLDAWQLGGRRRWKRCRSLSIPTPKHLETAFPAR
jgi:hypothetical protein